ncbi:Sec-independent protein translocase protein TatB [Pseudomonas sp. RP23018S]|uniref:Sec-independent protein translocase protein TatB n=1 Tax=Pseudomonas sp. RP23018S TaxID=3096037 RepID=UPI002ACAEC77|nr:Sec-independent protein translocase protein TatB [Pseudomonas sp. RP23018S]MDZ5604158.1 Sec-independent protein translocase protein TatB [Pseudomonas sp. RP23018S]
MFGISFGELLLVGLVALLVLGPDRLPGAARTAGLWIGRLKRSFNSIKMEVEREIGADDIRRQLHNEHILAMEQEARRILDPKASAPAEPADAPPAAPADATPPAAPVTEPPLHSAPTGAPARPDQAASTPSLSLDKPAATAPALPEPPQPPRAP